MRPFRAEFEKFAAFADRLGIDALPATGRPKAQLAAVDIADFACAVAGSARSARRLRWSTGTLPSYDVT